MPSQEIQQLEEHLVLWNAQYRSGNPLVSDEEYDKSLARLAELDPANALLSKVEPEVPGSFGGKVALPTEMLSMQKAYSWEEILKWGRQLEEAAKGAQVFLKALPKLDGFSAVLWHTPDGRVKMATRGDGVEGQDITHYIRRAPRNPTGVLTQPVKGEIVVDKQYFADNLSTKFKNTRSVIAAAIKVNQPEPGVLEAIQRRAIMFEPFNDLDAIYISLADLVTYGQDFLKDAWELHVSSNRYQCDGVVLEVTTPSVIDALGRASNYFNWQIAYKRNTEFADVLVIGEEWNTSRHGRVVPTILVEPTELGGVTISRVTGHNAANVINNGIREGAVVSLTRSGDVIPYIDKVVTPVGPASQPVGISCPSCGSPTVWNGLDLTCTSVPAACPAQKASAIEHFFKALQVDGFGPAICEDIARNARRPDPVRIVLDPEEALAGVSSIGANSRIWSELRSLKTREVDDWRVLAAFGIPGCGELKSRAILQEHRLEDLHHLSKHALEQIPGVGQKLANELHENLNLIGFAITQLQSTLRIKSSRDTVDSAQDGILKDQVVVFTGTMKSNKREAMAEHARTLCAEVGSSVTKKTTLLVAGDNVGENKLSAATRLGVRVVTEDEYLAMLGEQS